MSDIATCVIVLNQPIHKPLFDLVLAAAQNVVIADGGANHYRSAGYERVPDAIVGDLDSITAENKEYYSDKTELVDLSGDQDSTDL